MPTFKYVYSTYTIVFVLFVLIIIGVDHLTDYAGDYIIDVPTKIEVGQTWTRVDSTDPFEPPKFDTIVILEIERGYARINWNGFMVSDKLEGISCCYKILKDE